MKLLGNAYEFKGNSKPNVIEFGALQKVSKNTASKEIIDTLAYLVLGVVLAVASYAVLGAALQTKNPIVTVVSYSMVPTLTRGDLLVLHGVNVSELATGRENGTIVVYYHAPTNRLIVHRVWKINADGTIRTWGDANPSADPWNVEPDWIRGKMILRVPYLGYPRLWLQDLYSGKLFSAN